MNCDDFELWPIQIGIYVLYVKLILFRMGLFGAAHRWVGQRHPLSKICHTYPTMTKLGTVILYLKKVERIYESRDTALEFGRHQLFSPEISKLAI